MAGVSLLDLTCARWMQSLYDDPTGTPDPFTTIFRESGNFGVNMGVIEGPETLYLLFRGSVTVEDWFRDALSFVPETLPGIGTFPLGFSEGLMESRINLDTVLQKGKKIVLVGHSLGAAHAGIMAHILKKEGLTPSRVLLMGCPNLVLVPDPERAPLPEIVVSYRNGDDMVSLVPPEPWRPLVSPIKLEGGHDDFPNLFMFHHIAYYIAGLEKVLATSSPDFNVDP